MTSKGKRPGYYIAWVDLLYGQWAAYVLLFLAALSLANPPKSEGIETKAEFLVVLEWPKGSLDDIDLHVLLPDQRHVNFKQREVGFAVLDHDDMGTNGTYVDSAGKRTLIPEHKEVVSLRAMVPGTYAVNLHVFRAANEFLGSPADPPLPYSAKVRLIKLNPRFEELTNVDVPLTQVGEQKTAFVFTIADNGSVNVDKEADLPFLQLVPKEFQR